MRNPEDCTSSAPVTMSTRGILLKALLDKEIRQQAARGDDADSSSLSFGQNAMWREKVVNWYFAVVSSLTRQHQTTLNSADNLGTNPFYRSAVHVTAALLDNYLLSLPSELNRRYRHDRTAYQLLATTCLLLGMRLARYDQLKESKQQVRNDDHQGELKRTRTHRENMNQADQGETTSSNADGFIIPNAATLLRISAAHMSISEQSVMAMVREVTGSRAFPQSKLVTALDFLRAYCANTTSVSTASSGTDTEHPSGEWELYVSLSPADTEAVFRLADVSLRDATLSGYRPSVVACAAITLALIRSNNATHDVSSLRRSVYRSFFGTENNPNTQSAVTTAEARLLRSAQIVSLSRNVSRVRSTSAVNVIPLEED